MKKLLFILLLLPSCRGIKIYRTPPVYYYTDYGYVIENPYWRDSYPRYRDVTYRYHFCPSSYIGVTDVIHKNNRKRIRSWR